MFRRFVLRARARRRPGRGGSFGVSVLLALGLLALLLFRFNSRLRPVLEALAVSQVNNAVTAAVNDAVAAELSEAGVSYDDMVTIQTDENGRVTVLKSNMSRANLLRARLLDAALKQVSGLSEEDFSIPLGNLTGMDVFSGRGPGVRLDILAAGAAEAVFQNEFSAAGVNQTLHRILLEIRMSMRILLPGETLETEVVTQICVAETVIVGQVPETYLRLERGI